MRFDDRAVLTAIVFVLTSGCAWCYLPPSFVVTAPTAHRRFSVWTRAGLWRQLHRAVLDELGSQGMIWPRAVLDGASVRAKKGTSDRSEPVDRGKSGSKIHVLSDRAGVPSTISTVFGPCRRVDRASASSGARWSTTRPAADFEIPNSGATCRKFRVVR